MITSPDIEYNGIEVVAIGWKVVVLNAIRPPAVDVCRGFKGFFRAADVCRRFNRKGSFVNG